MRCHFVHDDDDYDDDDDDHDHDNSYSCFLNPLMDGWSDHELLDRPMDHWNFEIQQNSPSFGWETLSSSELLHVSSGRYWFLGIPDWSNCGDKAALDEQRRNPMIPKIPSHSITFYSVSMFIHHDISSYFPKENPF